MTAQAVHRRPTRWTDAIGVCSVLLALVGSAKADPRAVLELFTSQGCSSCPPADQILGELARDPDVIALSMPIDYWDYLGWKDTLADSRFTARQRAYSRMRGDREVYTPQMVVNGTLPVIGSDRDGIEQAMSETAGRSGVMSVPVTMMQSGRELSISIAAAPGQTPGRRAEVWICAIKRAVPITISRGENSGREVVYHNVVRNLVKVGDWNGLPGSWSVPLDSILRDGVDGAVVYVQDGSRDKPGPMLGAAMTVLPEVPVASRHVQ